MLNYQRVKISIQSCDPIWTVESIRGYSWILEGFLKELSFQNSALEGVHNTSMSFGPWTGPLLPRVPRTPFPQTTNRRRPSPRRCVRGCYAACWSWWSGRSLTLSQRDISIKTVQQKLSSMIWYDIYAEWHICRYTSYGGELVTGGVKNR